MTLSVQTSSPVGETRSPLPLLLSSSVPHAERAVDAGILVRVRRGVLASAPLWGGLAPWERYAARVHAAVLTNPGCVFSHESAAVLLGLPIIGEPRDVHVLDGSSATSRLTGGIRLHTTAGDRGIVDLGGILVTSVLATTIDLARSRHCAWGLAVSDAALRLDDTLTVEALVAHNESRLGSRGRRRARWALHRASPLAETTLESLSRAAIEWLGFEEPELQKWFDGDRVDMWWPGSRIIGESDGDVKYDGSRQDPVVAIRREKERDRRLAGVSDGLAHWGWADVARIDPLRSALRNAGLSPVAPESSPELYSLSALMAPRRRRGGETAPGRRD